MSDDLVKRLRRWRQHFGEPVSAGRSNPDNDMIYLLGDAADALEAKDAEIERLRAERDKWDRRVAYDELAAREYENRARQQRQIDDLTVRAEQAERALAEALSVVESLLLSLGNNNNSNRVKAARQFVKEHTP